MQERPPFSAIDVTMHSRWSRQRGAKSAPKKARAARPQKPRAEKDAAAKAPKGVARRGVDPVSAALADAPPTREQIAVRAYELFAKGENADLSPRNRAIFDFARKLSEAPVGATAEDMAALREAGLSEEEILDLILSSSLFGWANRLMHVLGDPVREEVSA